MVEGEGSGVRFFGIGRKQVPFVNETSSGQLGNIATRLGRSLTFDPQTEQIVGDDEANGLVRRQYRDHWATPKNL